MAIFGKERAQQGARHGTTIVSAGCKLVGNVALTDNLHVDGHIDGDIESDAAVVIGEPGTVSGHVHGDSVVVSGRIEGSVSARRLEIVAGGTVEGDVRTVDLVIEPGGRFNGSSEILSEESEAEATRTAPEVAREPGKKSARNKADDEPAGEHASAT